MSRDGSVRTLFKGGLLVFAGFVLDNIIAFFAKAISARYLGNIDYGSVALAVTVLSVLGGVLQFGLPEAISRYLPRTDNQREKRSIVASASHIVLLSSIVAAVGLYTQADQMATHVFSNPGVAPILRIVAIALPFSAVIKIVIGIARGFSETVPKIATQNVTVPSSRFLFVVIAVTAGLGTVGVTWAYVLAIVAGALVAVGIVLRQHSDLIGYSFDPRHVELFSFSLPLMFSAFSGQVLMKFDTLLLGVYRDTGAVGVYDVVYSVAMLLMIMLLSFQYLAMPTFSEYHSRVEYSAMRDIYALVSKWIFFGTFPLAVAFLVFPTSVINLTFGAQYVSGAQALQVLALGFSLHAFLGPNTNALTAIGQTKFVMVVNASGAVANVALNLVMIPQYGILGAATATLAAYAGMNIVFNAFLYRKYGITPLTRQLLVPVAASSILVATLITLWDMLFEPTLWPLVGLFIICLAFYPLVLVAVGGVGEDELIILKSIEHRFEINLDAVHRFVDVLGQR